VNLLERYRLMCFMRGFEERCIEGSQDGEVHGELHAGIGQEAIAAGMAGHLDDADAMVSTHRNHLHAIAKGVPPLDLMAEVFEREGGLCRGRGGHMHIFDPARRFSTTGIVGSSLPVALGYAYAARLDGSGAVAVGVTGDGGVNAGAFAETLNMAALWEMPLVVVVENNGWAISVPVEAASAGSGLFERARPLGIEGVRVDGTDVEAVSGAFAAAVAGARSGKPALIEATSRRYRGHYEGDLDLYRQSEEKSGPPADDPLAKASRKLEASGELSAAAREQLAADVERELDELTKAVREMSRPAAAGALRYVFADRAGA
jgi:pyruvate dehydrogenase E1 component alpha subunit